MLGVPADLIVPLDGIDVDQMLQFWRWLIPLEMQPIFATALGDLFLTQVDGSIWWLEMGMGELTSVAVDMLQFQAICADPNNQAMWFGRSFIEELRHAGKVLRHGECYSYWKLPLIGGGYEPANFRIYDVTTHFRVWGPIHESLKDVPDGSEIRFVIR